MYNADRNCSLGKRARVPMPHVSQHDAETGWQLRTLALPCTLTIGNQTTTPVVLNAILARGVSQEDDMQKSVSCKTASNSGNRTLASQSSGW